MVGILWYDHQFVGVSIVLYARWKRAGLLIAVCTGSDHGVLRMGLEVRGVEDDSADDQGNEEHSADNDDWLVGTEKHEPVLLRSFEKIAPRAASRRRRGKGGGSPFLCRLDRVWVLLLAAITPSLFFYASLIFGNRFRKLVGCSRSGGSPDFWNLRTVFVWVIFWGLCRLPVSYYLAIAPRSLILRLIIFSWRRFGHHLLLLLLRKL